MPTENTTASAMGMNRYFGAPDSRATGRNTTQMQRVATNAGTAISFEPSRIDWIKPLPMSMCRWMFSTVTVALSTRMPTESARPPSVIRLSVCPNADRQTMPASTETGIDTATITVLRQLPRNNRISSPVSAAAIRPSTTTPFMAATTNVDWSNNTVSFRSPGNGTLSSTSRAASTTSSVDACPVFSTDISTDLCPS